MSQVGQSRGALRALAGRSRTQIVVGLTVVASMLYASFVPGSSGAHTDHVAYLGTVTRMKQGAGYYTAYRDAYLQDVNIRMGRARAFRQPAIFLLWRWVPASALFLAFVALVVVLTGVLLAKASESTIAGLAAGLFLLAASRTTITEWLLVEFWCAPLVAAAALAWKRERWWSAAAAAGCAVLLRETAVLLLVAGFVLALLKRRPIGPWIAAGVSAAVLFALHYRTASQHVLQNGTDAALLGTGRPLATVFDMLTWPFQGELPVAWLLIAFWLLAVWQLWRTRRNLSPVAGLLLLPFLGLFMDRGYWGLLSTPYAVWLGAERIAGLGRRWALSRRFRVDAPSR